MSAKLFEFTFPFTRHYDVSPGRLPPRPGYPPVFYYPGGTREGGKDGPIFTITPQTGASWVGVFAYGGSGGPPAVDVLEVGATCDFCQSLSEENLLRGGSENDTLHGGSGLTSSTAAPGADTHLAGSVFREEAAALERRLLGTALNG